MSASLVKTRFRYNRAGFTLVELLVVIAIIAVLMTILMPALQAGRRLAKRIQCGGQLRQLAIAWTMYCEENEGRFYKQTNANLSYGGWIGEYEFSDDRPLNRFLNLKPGLGNPEEAKVFQCPADRGGAPGRQVYQKVFTLMGTSYNTNIFLVGQAGNGTFSQNTEALDRLISQRNRSGNLKITNVDNPARVLLMGDYGWVNQWDRKVEPAPEHKELVEWHGKPDHFSVAFVDGHSGFIEVAKGFYVEDDYTVLPFKDLYGLARELQDPDPQTPPGN
jgi:prepilin-type N-terminal cleavage/methylation domain-containing protein